MRNTLRFQELLGGKRGGAETPDRKRRSIQSQWRNDRVHARAVQQARIDHGRRLIHPAAHARDDAVDDLQQVAIVPKCGIGPLEDSALFNEDMILVIHQDVGDL